MPTKLQWLEDISLAISGTCWTINYISMIRLCYPHGTPFLPALTRFFHHTFTYQPRPYSTVLNALGIGANSFLLFMAIKTKHLEWFQLVAIITAAFVGHAVFVKQVVAEEAAVWVTAGTQVLLSVGALLRLWDRKTTRGGSYISWFSRFLGAIFSIPTMLIGYQKTYLWGDRARAYIFVLAIVVFLMADLGYGVEFYRIRRDELQEEQQRQKALGFSTKSSEIKRM